MFGHDVVLTIRRSILGHMLYQVGAAFEKSHTFVSMRARVEAEPGCINNGKLFMLPEHLQGGAAHARGVGTPA